ncbi:hypothetical protein IAU59_004348 [Kwoniella sp. CBS 9459]
MSHFRRSNFGRFQSNTATESYQRQLTAPVNKWKRQWVSPTGLAPESSYKICKWVKIKQKAKLAGAVSEAGDGDDVTPAPDGDDADEGDGEDMDEDDQGDEGDDNEGDEDEEDGEEGKATEDQTPAPSAAAAAASADSGANPVSTDTPALETKEASSPKAAPPSANPLGQTDEPTLPEGSSAAPPVPSTEEGTVEETTKDEGKEESHEAPVPPHHEIPSNAIEVSNVGPQSTESGLATVGTTEEGVEIEMRPAEEAVHAQPVQEDEQMDIDAAPAVEPELAVAAEGAELPAARAATPVEKDEGLVMGEMELPTDKAELKVDGGDHPPAEVEQ